MSSKSSGSDVEDKTVDANQDGKPVDKKVAVAVKHPGVFMETCELEAEAGVKIVVPADPKPKKEDEEEKVEEPADAPAEQPQEEQPAPKPRHSRRRASKRSSRAAKAKEQVLEEEEVKKETEDIDKVKTQGNDAATDHEMSKKEIEEEEEEAATAVSTEALVKQGSEIEVAAAGSAQSEATSSADEGSAGKDDKVLSATPRRSKRREQLAQIKEEAQQKAAAEKGAVKDDDELDEEPSEAVAEASADTKADHDDGFEDDLMDDDRLETEDGSVCSELDSVESGSTRSTRRGQRQGGGTQATAKHKKGTVRSSKKKLATVAQNRGKGRRAIFKRSATKAPTAVARAVTSDRVFYKGQYFTRGDIVSVVDVEGGVYYAQLKGFLTDQYCEKSGVITWLLPTTESPPPEEGFDPSTYIIGPEEELPRRLEHFTFVMHAPDDYFYYQNAPYPTTSINRDQEYVLTRLGPKVRLLKNNTASFS